MDRRALVPLSALACASLACSIFLGGPTLPDPAVPVSTQAAASLESAFQGALEDGAQTGTLSVELTESELTSYLQSRLAEQSDPPITQPQVTLRDGALQIFGIAKTGIFVANVSLTAQFSVDENGQPQINVTRADYGPFPAPHELTDALGALLRETLTGTLGPAAVGFRLESITIADGKLALTGRIK